MKSEERWYYLERARTSLEFARQARDPAIVAIHMELHERYMQRAAACSAPTRELFLVSARSAAERAAERAADRP